MGQAQDIGGEHVLERHVVGLLPGVAGALEDVHAAVRARALGEAQVVLAVGDVACDLLGVLLHQGALAAGQVDAVQVVPLGVAVVHADQDAVGLGRADADDLRGGFLERSQVAALVAGQVHRVQVEVLVAAVVAQVQQGVGAVGPEVVADAAGLVVGDRAAGGWIAGGRDPDVHHAIDRRDPAQVLAVRADLHARAFGIAEQRIARDQFHFLGCLGRGGCRRGGDRVVLLAAAGGQGKDEAGGDEQFAVAHGDSPGMPAASEDAR